MTMLTVAVAPRASQPLRDDAALIWAEATAHRDGDAEVASLEEARPFIDAVLDDSAASMLLIASDRFGWTPLGRPTPHPRSQRLEQRYRLALV